MNYHISRDGQVFGPYTIDDVHHYLASGNILSTDYIKSESMAEWTTVSALLSPASTPATAPEPAVLAQPATAPQPAVFAQPAAWQQAPAPATFPAPSTAQFEFFPVSTTKFVVLSIVTFGLYQIYWAYAQWVRWKARHGGTSMPWARALFLPIWNFALFDSIKRRGEEDGLTISWNHVLLGACVLLLNAAGRLPGAAAAISFLSFLPYLPVLRTVAAINAKVAREGITEDPNSRFTGANFAWIVVGGICFLLALVGFGAMLTGTVPNR